MRFDLEEAIGLELLEFGLAHDVKEPGIRPQSLLKSREPRGLLGRANGAGARLEVLVSRVAAHVSAGVVDREDAIVRADRIGAEGVVGDLHEDLVNAKKLLLEVGAERLFSRGL